MTVGVEIGDATQCEEHAPIDQSTQKGTIRAAASCFDKQIDHVGSRPDVSHKK